MGKHDWNQCEQIQLIAVDTEANTIRVRRACYGTKPLAFSAKSARAAAHTSEGPWGKNNHLMWYYNYATHCPRGSEGKTCADRRGHISFIRTQKLRSFWWNGRLRIFVIPMWRYNQEAVTNDRCGELDPTFHV